MHSTQSGTGVSRLTIHSRSLSLRASGIDKDCTSLDGECPIKPCDVQVSITILLSTHILLLV